MKQRITTSKSKFRTLRNVFILGSLSLFLGSCSSDDDGFQNANGNAAKKYITKVSVHNQDEGTTNTATVSYDSNGRVTSATDGAQTRYFFYDDNGNLEKISGNGDNLETGEVVGEIQNAYEIGNVLDFDDKGNPTVLELYGEDNYGNDATFTATLTYDSKPFTYYYTLDAAGIIDVLYDVRLQFYMPEKIRKARELLPVNNPTKGIVKDEQGNEVLRVTVDYQYDEDNYPDTAQMVTIDDEGYVETSTIVYTYKH